MTAKTWKGGRGRGLVKARLHLAFRLSTFEEHDRACNTGATFTKVLGLEHASMIPFRLQGERKGAKGSQVD
jgi:hypothetical protein